MSLRVAVYGLGPIGQLIAREVLKKKDLNLVAAFDVDQKKIGKDLAELLMLNDKTGVHVSSPSELGMMLKSNGVKVVLHSTLTYLDHVYPQIVKCIKAGANVISTSETLSNPYYRYPELAELIHEMAKKYCVTVIGTGVNPGFIFDTLPALLTAVCTEVHSIHVTRSLDAAKRRESFQRKYGLGLGLDKFKAKMEIGELTAHVGYGESISLLADTLHVKLDKIVEGQEPLIAGSSTKTQYVTISIGTVSGIHGYGIGFLDGKEFIKIDLFAEVDREEFEEVVVDGNPPLKWRSTGTAGDIATAAMAINLIPKLSKVGPGLLRMCDIPLPSTFLNLGVNQV
ncbi:MAG: dihydrodipicolinate reductase [Nitrososphaeria archaeon]